MHYLPEQPARRRYSWAQLGADAITLGCLLGLLAMGAFLILEWWELL